MNSPKTVEPNDKQLSWEDTFKAMAREREDWSDFEGTVADGLDPAARQ